MVPRRCFLFGNSRGIQLDKFGSFIINTNLVNTTLLVHPSHKNINTVTKIRYYYASLPFALHHVTADCSQYEYPYHLDDDSDVHVRMANAPVSLHDISDGVHGNREGHGLGEPAKTLRHRFQRPNQTWTQ